MHYTADFSEKVDEMQMLIKTGVMDGNPIKYLPNILELAFKGLVYGIKTKKYMQIQPIRTFKRWNLKENYQ